MNDIAARLDRVMNLRGRHRSGQGVLSEEHSTCPIL